MLAITVCASRAVSTYTTPSVFMQDGSTYVCTYVHQLYGIILKSPVHKKSWEVSGMTIYEICITYKCIY